MHPNFHCDMSQAHKMHQEDFRDMSQVHTAAGRGFLRFKSQSRKTFPKTIPQHLEYQSLHSIMALFIT